jgi:hypothetical protein
MNQLNPSPCSSLPYSQIITGHQLNSHIRPCARTVCCPSSIDHRAFGDYCSSIGGGGGDNGRDEGEKGEEESSEHLVYMFLYVLRVVYQVVKECEVAVEDRERVTMKVWVCGMKESDD